MRYVWDSETKGLLNCASLDYNSSPYSLRDKEFIHCVGFLEVDSGEYHQFVGREVYTHVKQFILDTATELIAHNSINFDHLVLQAGIGLDYTIGCSKLGIPDTVGGKPIKITDTLVMSKTLNPDRPQHSIGYFGSILGLEKIDWRAKAIELGIILPDAPKGAEFLVYHEEMGVYMMRDCHVNKRVWKHLLAEWGTWDWTSAYELEKAVAEIITRQEHRGFKFDRDKAVTLVKDLDTKMEHLRTLVEPLIPEKALTQSALDNLTPTAKQFKKNGEPTVHILNFAKKHDGEFVECEDGKWRATLYGKEYTLPMEVEPLYTHQPATLNDTLHIKEWLVGLNWNPSGYKERDLTVDSKKKKISKEKFDIAVEKWVDQTFASNFKADRLEELGYTSRVDIDLLKHKLKNHEHMERPLKVNTNPMLCKGQEKEIDPNLLLLVAHFPYAKELSDYLTYKHRRNSILGGKADPDDDDEMEKGWLAVERLAEDGRIPTPADTCGAATSRFKHRLVANVPRVTSLYGHEMRSLFGVDVEDGFYQLGADIDSLEACIEAHYTYRYEGGIEYGKSLTAEKPNDCHTVLAAYISELLGKPFPRGTAKNVKYGCSYNAQIARVAKTVGCSIEDATIIFNAFWDKAYPLKQLKEAMQRYWETIGNKKFLLGIDGRKLPVRSKGNVINTAFQSAGVICAKRAMVIHDRLLKEEGLNINFFTQDWINSSFCQQTIAYHDEVQCEVRKGMVVFKKFKDEQEAKAFICPEGKRWSDIIHNEKGYFRAYCRAGELAASSVTLAGEYYNLNVKLTAGYIVGRNWAECH